LKGFGVLALALEFYCELFQALVGLGKPLLKQPSFTLSIAAVSPEKGSAQDKTDD
jgi:hypothetical protein